MTTSKGFDRSKYKGTSVSKLNQQEEEIKSKIPQTGGSDRAGFHTIEEGVNYFRVYPGKADEDTYIYPKVVSWVPVEVDEKEDKRKDKSKPLKKGIFNAKVHGNLPDDLVEAYIRIATKLVRTECQDNEEANKILWPLISWRDGISPQANWVLYCDKHSDGKNNKDTKKIFGRLEIWESIWKEMKKKAAAMEDDDDVVSDPFSDPDNGKLLVITKTTKPKKGGGTTSEYDVSIRFDRDYKLTDEQLENFEIVEGLSTMFVNSFRRSDFEAQIEGLRLIEAEHNYGVFDHPEFVEIMDKLDEMIPEDDKKEDKKGGSKPEKKSEGKSDKKTTVKEKPKKVEEPEEEEENLSFLDNPDFSKMNRKQLKNFIMEKELPITVTGSMDDEQIRELIQEELDVKGAKEEVAGKKDLDKDDDVDRINKGEHSEEKEEDDVDSKLNKYRQSRKSGGKK